MCNQQRLRRACAYVQSDQSLCWSLEYSMNIQLLTEHHLEFLSFKGVCTGSSASTLAKMPQCWKSHDMVQMFSVKTSTNAWAGLHDFGTYQQATKAQTSLHICTVQQAHSYRLYHVEAHKKSGELRDIYFSDSK